MDLDFTGKLSIIETAKVVSQLDCLITTDSGNMHLADLLSIPLIALFGPTLVSKNRPIGKMSKVLRSGLPCSPCQDTSRFSSCAVNDCMGNISVSDVTSVTREILSLVKVNDNGSKMS
jgi:ADP-heptose:LPS heptosyltransferase